jgi:organic radical activating enzyme
MQKYKVDYLDLVIIRSCQLACEGCCTFSDHQKINGLVSPTDAEEAIKFFSQYIDPTRVHLFGGEPTMHPQLMEWFRLAFKYWPLATDQKRLPIWLNTNGYYIDKLFDHIEELFVENQVFVSVTHHTTEEPYSSLVLNNYQQLQDLILEAYSRAQPEFKWFWAKDTVWDTPHKKFVCLENTQGHRLVMLNMTEQHEDHFVPHYKGYGETLKPWHEYSAEFNKQENHDVCHIKNYVQFYDNKLWKCPPRAVLNQTLDTYKLQNDPDWTDYYNNYKSLGVDATAEEIDSWFAQQKLPEDTCNMCGFMYSNQDLVAQQHLPKKMFKIKS